MSRGILRRLIKKRKEEKEEANRVIHPSYPDHVPLNLRVGALVKIPIAPFILHEDYLRLEDPGRDHIVEAISYFHVFGLDVIRAHLKNVEDDEQASILQLNILNNELTGIILFREVEEIYPASEEEWDRWLNEEDGIIGDTEFHVTKEGGEPDIYEREWDPDVAGRINPVDFTERIFTDQYENPDIIDHESMLYSRAFEDVNPGEYALISVPCDAEDQACVSIAFGIELEPGSINVN